MGTNIRQAQVTDCAALLSIYRPIVENTAISFELTLPSADAFAQRIDTTIRAHEWLVMENGSEVIGYAYATPHRPREAYQCSVETSVYVREDCQGNGAGKKLYQTLFASLTKRGFHNAFAGISLPNPGSIALHKAVGFEAIGVFREVGRKFDVLHDVSWWQRKI